MGKITFTSVITIFNLQQQLETSSKSCCPCVWSGNPKKVVSCLDSSLLSLYTSLKMNYVESYIPSNKSGFTTRSKCIERKMVVTTDVDNGLLPTCAPSQMTITQQESHQNFFLRNSQCKQELTVELECYTYYLTT